MGTLLLYNAAIHNFLDNVTIVNAQELYNELCEYPNILQEENTFLIEQALKRDNKLRIQERVEYSSTVIDSIETYRILVYCTQLLILINARDFSNELGIPVIIALMRNAVYQIPLDSPELFSNLLQQFSDAFHGTKLDQKSSILLSEIIAYGTFLPNIDEIRKRSLTVSLIEMLDGHINCLRQVAYLVTSYYLQTYNHSFNVVCVVLSSIHGVYKYSFRDGEELCEELAVLYSHVVTRLTPTELKSHYFHFFLQQVIGQLQSGRESVAYQFSSILAEKFLKLLHPASMVQLQHFCDSVANYIPTPIRDYTKGLQSRRGSYIPLRRVIARKILGITSYAETYDNRGLLMNDMLKVPIHNITRFFKTRRPNNAACHNIYIALARRAIEYKDVKIVQTMDAVTKEYHQPVIKKMLQKNLKDIAREVYELQPPIILILLRYTCDANEEVRESASMYIKRIHEDVYCHAVITAGSLRSINRKTPILHKMFPPSISNGKFQEKYKQVVSELIESQDLDLAVAIVTGARTSLISPHTIRPLLCILQESNEPEVIGMTVKLFRVLLKYNASSIMFNDVTTILWATIEQYVICRNLTTHYNLESLILQLVKISSALKPKVVLHCASLFDDVISRKNQLSYWDAQRCVSAMHLLGVPSTTISQSIIELAELCAERDAFLLTNISYLCYNQRTTLLAACDPGLAAALVSHQEHAHREICPMLIEYSLGHILKAALINLSDIDTLATLGIIIRRQQVDFGKCVSIIVAMCFNTNAFISHEALELLAFMCSNSRVKYFREFIGGISLFKDNSFSTELFPEIWAWWRCSGLEQHHSEALCQIQKLDPDNSKWVHHVVLQGASHKRVDKWQIRAWLKAETASDTR